MSVGAWIFMSLTWAFVIWLTVYSFAKFLGSGKGDGPDVPPTG